MDGRDYHHVGHSVEFQASIAGKACNRRDRGSWISFFSMFCFIISATSSYPSPISLVMALSYSIYFYKLSMQAWNEQPRAATSKRTSECIIHLRKKHRRMRLPNTITIDSIYEKKFLSVNSILEAVVLNAYLLPGGLKCELEWFFETSICSPLLKLPTLVCLHDSWNIIWSITWLSI